MKELTLLTTGFVFGFLACAVCTVVVLHEEIEAWKIVRNHRRYMETEYKIDDYLEELTADRSGDA